MKNKIFKQIIGAIIISLFLCSFNRPAHAWSTYTHAAVSAEALSKYSSLMPQAVFGSSLPDITTNFISPASKDKFYGIFHGENFYKAMLNLLSKLDKNRDKTMICNIYGYFSHIAADETAHEQTGYANSKTTFNVKTELNHYVAYLFMDMLCYYDYFYGYNSRFGKFVADGDFSVVKAALEEHNRISSEQAQFSKSEFAKKELMFKAGIAVQKAIFDILIDDNPELFEQLRSFYGDYYLGVNGVGGFYDTAAGVEEKITAGAYSRLSEGALKSFANKQISDITYIGMQFVSIIARDTDFIRTSKLTSNKIENLVSKFFESKSASTQSMGKFLSALLLKKGLTYEEVIAYTDGAAAPAANESEKSKKYKSAYKKLKEPRWYSFIPGTDSKEKREYIDAFIDYQKEKTENEIKEAGLSPRPADVVRNAQDKRLSAYREMYLASKLNPLNYIAKKAANDAAFINSSVVKSYVMAKKRAGAQNDAKLSGALDLKVRAFINKNLKAQKTASGRKLIDKLSGPLKSIYEKEYVLAVAANNADIEKTILNSSSAAVSAAPDEITTPGPAAVKITGVPAGLTAGSALASMQKAYKEYVKLLNASDINDERARIELDRSLKTYIYYKSAYEKLYIDTDHAVRE